MISKILLPKIKHFDLVGFRPIFSTDIHMKIGDGPNVVLGGNGLGKTTIMQAITYCLTGGTSTIEDEEKREKWDHKYFRDRMDQSATKSAYVEVSFSFQADMYSVRRGFSNNSVIAFRQNKSDWIDSVEEAHELFLRAITNDGNYQSEDDFAFVVHRLLYLPESRRLLAWDIDAQLRTLMLLNQDIQSESDFRQRRKEIKELDSEMRHIHVAIGKVKEQIEASGQRPAQSTPTSPLDEKIRYEQLAQQLNDQIQRRVDLENKLMSASDYLSAVSTEIERLRDEEENAEATLISHLLREHESTSNLALSKLKDRGICPACGTKQKLLQDKALEHLRKHQCMLCGSDEPQENTPQLSTLQSQINEKVSAQKNLERKYLDIAALLDSTKREVNRLEFEQSKHWYKFSDIGQIERQENVKMGEDPNTQLKKLQHKEKDYELQIQKRKGELERDYATYNTKLSSRLETLRSSYEYYATKFLGTKCSLTERKIDQQIQLTHYIPEFNGKTRASPDACSEAQRFFLDIAFRMALIDFAKSAKGSGTTTFICETPETALDYSYIDNVVDMFQAFSDRKHSLLISSNIQRDSIASKLVNAARLKRKKSNIINLLEIGQLSDVQMKAKSKLDEIAKEITGEA